MIRSLFSSSAPPTTEMLKAEIIGTMARQEPLLKFAYLGEGARAWNVFRSGEECNVGSREVDALALICKAFEPELRANGAGINVIHLGSGNGVEIPTLFELFHLSDLDSYTAVDVSHDLLELLVHDFSKFLNDKAGAVSFFQADATDPHHLAQISQQVRKTHPGINLIVAAGEGTLLSDPAVLTNIRTALGPSDYALFSLDGCNASKTVELCAQYNSDDARNFLTHAIACAKRVGALPDQLEGEFLPAVFDQDEKQLRVYYQPRHGEKILVLRSLKPQKKDDITRMFSRGGLVPVRTLMTERTSFGIICKAAALT